MNKFAAWTIGFFLLLTNCVWAQPLFVQQNYAVPQTNQSSVAVIYTTSQVAGNTNIIAVGWSSATGTISSVVDNGGNTYTLAVALARGTGVSQAIYYAKNISAGAHTVTVTFSTAVPFADVRITEYSGLDGAAPFVAGSSASGNATTSTTPAIPSVPANSLIFAAGTTSLGFTAAGSGFTSRVITNQDGDIVEDKVVATAGSYNATAAVTGNWIFQEAAFKPPAGGDTQAPSVPANVAGNATSSTTTNLTWNASTDNVGVTGYRVYRNNALITTVTTLSFGDTGLSPSTTYSYQVSAIDAANNESARSTAINVTTQAPPDTQPPTVPLNFVATNTTVQLSWSVSSDNVGVTGYRVYRNNALITTVTTLNYNDTGLTQGTTYAYQVSSIDAAGNESARSATINVTTGQSASIDMQAPSTPANLAGNSPSSTTVNLTWSASTDNVGVTGYKVFRNNVAIANNVTTTSYSDTGLTASTTYNYNVLAFDAAGNQSAQSATVPVTTQGTVAPGFYMATNGNDNNAGTLAAPFLTMAKCQTAMRGSSTKTCYLRTGTYVRTTELLLTSLDNNQTWTTYPLDANQSAVLQYSGSGFIMNHITGASNITFSNLTMDGGASGGNGNIFGAVFIENSSDGIYVRQNKFINNFNQTDLYVYNSDNIYFQGNVSGPNEYQPVSGYVTDGAIHGHWFFTDNNLSGFARMGIEMGGDPAVIHFKDVHVDRNTITKHVGPAADSMAISFVIGNSSICNTIWGNTLLGTSGIGMWGIEVGAAITSVEQNTMTDIDVPIMIAAASGTVIENNSITNFGHNPPFNNYAFSEDGGYNNTQWVGNNTLDGTVVTGWIGHPNSGAKPTVCTPSTQFP